MDAITIREHDNRHPADLERMRGDLAAEVTALRAEVRRLRATNTDLALLLVVRDMETAR